MIVLSGAAFAAKPTTAEINSLTSKLESNKTKLLNNLENSKKKLKSIADETKKFADTTLFDAASCLGAIPKEDQNLDFNKLTDNLKTSILNEYIGLDGDIKRYSLELKDADPILLGNTLDNFYNQNAIKITNLENEYYLKSGKTKATFLEYVKNNQDLLNGLAQKLDIIKNVNKYADAVSGAFSGLNNTINSHSSLWSNKIRHFQVWVWILILLLDKWSVLTTLVLKSKQNTKFIKITLWKKWSLKPINQSTILSQHFLSMKNILISWADRKILKRNFMLALEM